MSQITRHQTTILAYLLALIPSPQDAEDVLQRTNLVLWRKHHQFEPGTNFRAWAFATARWEALAFLKERKRENWLVFNDEIAASVAERMASVPDGAFERQPDALRKCLGKLSEKNRRLLLDRYQTGHTLGDCARRAGRSENGLKVTFHRLRISLRRCMSRQLQSHSA